VFGTCLGETIATTATSAPATPSAATNPIDPNDCIAAPVTSGPVIEPSW